MQAARGASLSSSDPKRPADRTPSRRRLLALFGVIALLGYALDVLTKVLVVDTLSDRPPVDVVGHYVRLTLARNPGAAFSTGTSYTLVLSCIALIAAVAVLWIARRLGSTGWAIGLGFLLAGIVGNLTDRIFREPGFLRGHVVDFLQLPNWPIFNVADVCINIAAGVLILQAVRGMSVNGTRSRKSDDPAPAP